MATWFFQRMDVNGSPSGDAQNKVFAGHDAHISLAKEAIQNSIDAHAEGNPQVQIDFEFVTLDSEQKSDFVKRLNLSELYSNGALLGLGEDAVQDLQTPNKQL